MRKPKSHRIEAISARLEYPNSGAPKPRSAKPKSVSPSSGSSSENSHVADTAGVEELDDRAVILIMVPAIGK